MQLIFPDDADKVGRLLVEQCGQNLPFCGAKSPAELERLRFAALKISEGNLERLRRAVDEAKRDWRDELVWAGFAERLDAHVRWAAEMLGEQSLS